MDGTLIDSSSTVPDAFIETVRALNGTVHSREEVVALYSLGPPRAMLTRLLDRPCGDAEVALYHDVLAGHAARVAAYDGVETVLARLGATTPMGVFTGASRRAAHILLESAGLRDHFPVIVGGDEVERPKPDPEGILRVCSLLSVPASSAMYVGDAPTDLEAARRAGCLAVAAGWGHLHDGSAPAHLVARTPADLLDGLHS